MVNNSDDFRIKRIKKGTVSISNNINAPFWLNKGKTELVFKLLRKSN